jgi:two-component system phosphate regulon sensor histidine kinase PhoR
MQTNFAVTGPAVLDDLTVFLSSGILINNSCYTYDNLQSREILPMSSNHNHNQNPLGCGPKPSGSWIDILEDRATTDSIIDGLRDGIILHDQSGKILRMNRSMERILDVSEGASLGKDLNGLFGGFDVCSLAPAPDSPEAVSGRATRNIRGREYEVACSSIAGSRPDKQLTITVLHDVTEEVHMERQRSDTLSMVSHDVRGPLTTVLGYCELILLGNMGEASPEIMEGVEAISRSGKKILDIIEDFLIVAKAEAGKLKPAFTIASLGDICSTNVIAQKMDAERLGKRIECSSEEGLPGVECDPRLIDRIVYNLVDNAIKYSKEGGGIFVDITGQNGDEVEISVRDEGAGIPEAELPHVFERYWRGSNVGSAKGSGLGLTIVKRLVDMHHGTISVESHVGEGATFRVRLPVSQP